MLLSRFKPLVYLLTLPMAVLAALCFYQAVWFPLWHADMVLGLSPQRTWLDVQLFGLAEDEVAPSAMTAFDQYGAYAMAGGLIALLIAAAMATIQSIKYCLAVVPVALVSGLGVFAAYSMAVGAGWVRFDGFDSPMNPAQSQAFAQFNVQLQTYVMAALGAVGTLIAVFGMISAAVVTPRALRNYRRSIIALYAVAALFAVTSMIWASAFAKAELWDLEKDKLLAVSNLNLVVLMHWWSVTWPWLVGVCALALLHTFAWRRATINVYAGLEASPDIHLTDPAPGDRVLEDLRTHGPQPEYRKSIYSSTAAHVFILFILPLLLTRGCSDAYLIPEGSGNPVVMMVQVVKPKKKKPKKYILPPDSAIYFHVPDLDESKIEDEVKAESEVTYKANNQALVGMMGAGGGKTGGWPEGMGREPIRFIRLKYNGKDWDDGMGSDGADLAFLNEFEKTTGFKTANRSEAIDIRALKRFRKGFAPPFVYMTGNGHVSIGGSDQKALREYLLNGGMLFADAGSRSWDRSFRSFIGQVFRGKRLVPISRDDPLFNMPYQFPDGPPMMWEHGGSQCWGMKHKGRWVVFYHPGDMNDAWKGGSVSGLTKAQTDGAFELGVNIIYYAFTNYLEVTKKDRKK